MLLSKLERVSAYNGNFLNYKKARERLSNVHTLESGEIDLIDSEGIPHFFEELLTERKEADEAFDAVFSTLQGPNAVSLLQIGEACVSLDFFHKGKTKRLTNWTNKQNEVIFCSRKEPLIEEFGNILAEREFEEKILISYDKDSNLRLSLSFEK